jgi:hypothetical protein
VIQQYNYFQSYVRSQPVSIVIMEVEYQPVILTAVNRPVEVIICYDFAVWLKCYEIRASVNVLKCILLIVL